MLILASKNLIHSDQLDHVHLIFSFAADVDVDVGIVDAVDVDAVVDAVDVVIVV